MYNEIRNLISAMQEPIVNIEGKEIEKKRKEEKIKRKR